MAGANEKRLTSRLITYWSLVKKDNPMPLIEHFNAGALDDVWQQCMMLSVDTRKGAIFKCEYMGDLLIDIYGIDMKGEVLESRNVSFPGLKMYKILEEMVGKDVPHEDGGFFLNNKGDMVKYRACFLPFGSETRGLTNVIIGMSFRAF